MAESEVAAPKTTAKSQPRVLVDVEYRAKTKASGLLRHPSFKGVRRDLMEPPKTKSVDI